jgi:hypothetical protein
MGGIVVILDKISLSLSIKPAAHAKREKHKIYDFLFLSSSNLLGL